MDEERTFGIEIEARSKISRERLAELIALAFAEGNCNHLCMASGYGHDTSSTNRNVWKIKTDSSINTSREYPYNIEIVSPVLKGLHGVEIIKLVCDTIREHVSVNTSCGFHVHHAIKPHERSNLNNVINSWFKCEAFFLSALPMSRRRNYSYCAPWSYRTGRTRIREGESVQNWWVDNINSRYVTLNFESLWMRGTLEFRCHSGTYEYSKIRGWLIATQTWLVKAVNDDFSNVDTFESMTAILKGSTSSEGFLFHPNAKRQKLPRPGTKGRLILDGVLASKTRNQITEELHENFGFSPKHFDLIGYQVTDARSLKYGFGWDIAIDNHGKYHVRNVEAGGRTTTDATPDIVEAVDWLKDRKDHFDNQYSRAAA